MNQEDTNKKKEDTNEERGHEGGKRMRMRMRKRIPIKKEGTNESRGCGLAFMHQLAFITCLMNAEHISSSRQFVRHFLGFYCVRFQKQRPKKKKGGAALVFSFI